MEYKTMMIPSTHQLCTIQLTVITAYMDHTRRMEPQNIYLYNRYMAPSVLVAVIFKPLKPVLV